MSPPRAEDTPHPRGPAHSATANPSPIRREVRYEPRNSTAGPGSNERAFLYWMRMRQPEGAHHAIPRHHYGGRGRAGDRPGDAGLAEERGGLEVRSRRRVRIV